MKFKLKKNSLKYLSIFLILIVLILTMSSEAYAKFKSFLSTNTSARVGNFGELSFYEYTIDGNKQVIGESAQVETFTVIAGEDIAKNLSLSYSGNEIPVYVYLIIEANDWLVIPNDTTNKITLQSNKGDDLIYWYLSNDWTYLETKSNENQFVFYHLVEANKELDEKLIETFNVNAMDFSSIDVLQKQENSISFKTHAISALGVSPDKAFEYINN